MKRRILGVQHTDSLRLLDLLSAPEARLYTYKSAAAALGRDPQRNSRAVAQMCGLLDAAAALAGVPLFALVRVRNVDGQINPKAFYQESEEFRHKIIERAQRHTFTDEYFAKIRRALEVSLAGLGNLRAWKLVRREVPDEFLLGTHSGA